MGARPWSERRCQAPPAQPPGPVQAPHTLQQQTVLDLNQPQTVMDASSLYTASTVQERARLQSGALHDRQVLLQSVQTDLLLDLPHAIALPDGEEECGAKILQGAEEIYRSYIKPPPNRTIWEGGCPPQPPHYHHHHQQRSASTTNITVARDTNSRPHRASFPQGSTTTTNYRPAVEYLDPPPCYSDVIASRDYHRRTATSGGRNVQKSEL